MTPLEMTDLRHYSKWSRKFRCLFAIAMVVLALIAFIGVSFLFFDNVVVFANSDGQSLTLSPSKNDRPSASSWFDAVCSTVNSCPSGYNRSPLIMLSLDGFAARYFDRNLTPSLKRLADCGSRPPFMSPVFPTKTFSNHYSIVTGLYPSVHGIVDNTMYDPLFNKTFDIKSPDSVNVSWWGGEPIWLTAKRQGLKTASYFWPGSDVIGITPDYFKPYQRNASFEDRVNQVLKWLDLPAGERPDLITMYFEEPDSSGHKYGPESQETNTAIQGVDNIIGQLLEGLHNRQLIGCINLVIVSDHGMSETSCDRAMYLNELVPNFTTDNLFFVQGTVGHLRPLNGDRNQVIRLKDEFQCKSPHFWIYSAEDFPVRWEYSGHRRIDPLLFDADTGWSIYADVNAPHKYCRGGDHGFDNFNEDMLAIFIAHGSAFKMNYTAEPFLNIQVYNLLSDVLGIEPAPNNGTKGTLRHMLRTVLPQKYIPEVDHGLSVCTSSMSTLNWTGSCNGTASKRLEKMRLPVETISVGGIVLGLPLETDGIDFQICSLPYETHLTGFSQKTKSPMWTMFTLNSKDFSNNDVWNISYDYKWLNDPRLGGVRESPSCFRYKTETSINDGILQVSLLPDFFVDVYVITNAVPMYDGFHSGIWNIFWSEVLTWAKELDSINVIVGPVWDPMIEIPTHYFVILTYAVNVNGNQNKSLDTLGFIIPHQKSIPHCWDAERYLRKHQASIDVIETKIGRRFFSGLPLEESMRLRFKLVQTHPSIPFFKGKYCQGIHCG